MGGDGAEDIQAVHVGQAEIQQGGIELGACGIEGQQGVPAGADGDQAETLPAEMLFQAKSDFGVVFKKEDARHEVLFTVWLGDPEGRCASRCDPPG